MGEKEFTWEELEKAVFNNCRLAHEAAETEKDFMKWWIEHRKRLGVFHRMGYLRLEVGGIDGFAMAIGNRRVIDKVRSLIAEYQEKFKAQENYNNRKIKPRRRTYKDYMLEIEQLKLRSGIADIYREECERLREHINELVENGEKLNATLKECQDNLQAINPIKRNSL